VISGLYATPNKTNQDQSIIDAQGELHQIIAGGVDRKRLLTDDVDRDIFLNRLENILTQTACFSWALIPNHFHLFLKTETTSTSTVMRRFLTGYAVSYN